MIKAIKTYFRTVRRSKLSFVVNIIGLTVGLACTFLIYLWVTDELGVDKFHKKNDRLYQVMMSQKVSGVYQTAVYTPIPLGEALQHQVPGVENGVAVAAAFKQNTISLGERTFKAKGVYADKGFFNVFSFDLLEGNKSMALSDVGSIVITKAMALKLFGTADNIVGRSVEFDRKERFLVSGVVDDVPSNSTIQFDFVLPILLYKNHTNLTPDWQEFIASTYILLNRPVNGPSEMDRLNNQVQEVLKKSSLDAEQFKIFARPFSSGYLHGNYDNGRPAGGRIDYVKFFIVIVIVIMLIACINFIILSTAMITNRLKEVGMRKVLGADKKAIIIQHLQESVILAFLALLLAILFVYFLLPSFNALADKNMHINWQSFLPFLLITLLTGLLAGVYPAFYISKFKPMMIKSSRVTSSGGGMIRNGLVITQFAISSILIVFTIVVYSQISMIQNHDRGYNKDNIIYFDMDGRVSNHTEAFLAGLKRVQGVQHASSIFTLKDGFFGKEELTSAIDWTGKSPEENALMHYRTVGYDMIELLGLEMKAGQPFSKKFVTQPAEVIVNETAVKTMGLKDPVGKIIKIWGNDFAITGVVKDFHIKSIHEGGAEPILLPCISRDGFGAFNTIMVKVNGNDLDGSLAAIKEYYGRFNPGFPLDFKFLDQDFQKLYSSEQRMSVLSRYFAGLAILISCLGLFGLVAFTVNKKRKEISTRMILGATSLQIILYLYKDISKLVLVALLIGLPVGYILTHKWLNGFSVRIALEPWFFILAGALSFILMLIVSGIQVLKVLSINPIESLRSE